MTYVRRGKWTVETYLYLHNQTEDGFVVRFVHKYHNKKMYDESKYFSRYRHGSLMAALVEARRWKNKRLSHHLSNIRPKRTVSRLRLIA